MGKRTVNDSQTPQGKKPKNDRTNSKFIKTELKTFNIKFQQLIC